MKAWVIAIISFLVIGLVVVVLFANILGGGSNNETPTAQEEDVLYNEDGEVIGVREVFLDKEVGAYIGNLQVASGNDNYQVVENTFGATAQVYIDRQYLVATSPPELETAPYIQTADNEASATDDEFLSFQLHQPATMYVMYDNNATALPNWLRSWTNTGETVTTRIDNTEAFVYFNAYSKAFPAGSVTLGGNLATGAAGAEHNYFVLVTPNYDL